MAQKQNFPIGEQLDTIVEMIALLDQGKEDEAFKLRKKIPLPHYMGQYAKEFLGLDFLKNCGWNMSEVEAVYGKDFFFSE